MALEHASEHPDERLALASREWGEELVLNLDYRLVESPEPPRAGCRDRELRRRSAGIQWLLDRQTRSR
jgi:hypothetical protein